MGDLNYRIDLELEDALYFIKIKDIQSLIVKDQLFIEISKGLDMDNFIEGKINFMPTFKYEIGTNHYEGKPSWTDRILYKSKKKDDIIQIKYSDIEDIRISDHKPVYSVFKIF